MEPYTVPELFTPSPYRQPTAVYSVEDAFISNTQYYTPVCFLTSGQGDKESPAISATELRRRLGTTRISATPAKEALANHDRQSRLPTPEFLSSFTMTARWNPTSSSSSLTLVDSSSSKRPCSAISDESYLGNRRKRSRLDQSVKVVQPEPEVVQTPQADKSDEVIVAAGYNHAGDLFNTELFPDDKFGVSMVRESLTEACIKAGTRKEITSDIFKRITKEGKDTIASLKLIARKCTLGYKFNFDFDELEPEDRLENQQIYARLTADDNFGWMHCERRGPFGSRPLRKMLVKTFLTEGKFADIARNALSKFLPLGLPLVAAMACALKCSIDELSTGSQKTRQFKKATYGPVYHKILRYLQATLEKPPHDEERIGLDALLQDWSQSLRRAFGQPGLLI